VPGGQRLGTGTDPGANPPGLGFRRIGQHERTWIELTDHDGPLLRVNLDNVTHIEARTIEGRVTRLFTSQTARRSR
jgi:hypothetical protein